MTVFELQRILGSFIAKRDGNGLLPVYVTDGATGIIQSADGGTEVQVRDIEIEGGDILDEPVGTEFYSLYTG